MPRIPLIGVTACRQQLGKYSSHTVGDKYVEAAAFAGLPVLLPALGTQVDPAHWLNHVHGLFFTGSPSNVEPSQYNGAPSLPGTAHDPHRDRLTLPLLKAAIAKWCTCLLHLPWVPGTQCGAWRKAPSARTRFTWLS